MTPPTLETPRLILRPFVPGDLDGLAEILADPDVVRYLPGGAPRTREQSERTLNFIMEHWEQHGIGWWAVTLKATGELIGWCGLKLVETTGETEVLYMFAKTHWGRGHAIEAAQASLRYGFEELGLERIIAVAVPENTASRHVMEKLGMRYEGIALYYDSDLACYSIRREAFQPGGSLHVVRRA
jgi:ribosomal-protein-alanine N-acetyltransferase